MATYLKAPGEHQMTTSFDTIAPADVMKMSRHLTASQMARIGNSYSHGTDWRGSTKGDIAKGIAPRVRDGGFRLRVKGNHGKFGVTRADIPTLKALVARMDAEDTADAAKVAAMKAAGRRDYFGIENPAMFRRTEMHEMQDALKFAEALPA